MTVADETPAGPEGSDAEPSAAAQRTAVRDRYGSIGDTGGTRDPAGSPNGTGDRHTQATEDGGCCGGSTTADTSCCSGDSSDEGTSEHHAEVLGYSPADLAAAPDGAELGLGCGNPTALAALEPGETVVDLGSGGGFDCFLAAAEVRPDGRVIGVDMTPEMVERARSNAERNGYEAVEFRLGEIEHLPVGDAAADVIISNCVINLSPAKAQVFEEAFRVLKPGGRLAISDIVTTPAGREALDRTDLDQLSQCIAGAATIDELTGLLEDAGFQGVSVRPKENSQSTVRAMFEDEALHDALRSAIIEAEKPTR